MSTPEYKGKSMQTLFHEFTIAENKRKEDMVNNRPGSVEEMMKLREAETSNINYLPPLTHEQKGRSTYVERSNEERMNDMKEKNSRITEEPIYKFSFCIGDESVSCAVSGMQETRPPILIFDRAMTLPGTITGFSLPEDFQFEKNKYVEIEKKIVFILQKGEHKFEVNIQNKGLMKSNPSRTPDERYEELGLQYQSEERSIIFENVKRDPWSQTALVVCKYDTETNMLDFVTGRFQLSPEQSSVLSIS